MSLETKYRPQTFSDLVISDDKTRQRLLEYATGLRHRNVVLHGPHGTAKSTTAQIIQNTRFAMAKQSASCVYHASEINEQTFKEFRQVWSNLNVVGIKHPVIVIDEVDQIKLTMQHRLRPLMDRNDWGSFVLTTNNIHNVDKGVVDRCDVIELPAIDQAAWFDRAKFILQAEGITRSDEDVKKLLSTTDGSIRDVMDALQDAVMLLAKNVPAQTTQLATPVAPMSVHLIPPMPSATTP